jgi:hypothetical protein
VRDPVALKIPKIFTLQVFKYGETEIYGAAKSLGAASRTIPERFPPV